MRVMYLKQCIYVYLFCAFYKNAKPKRSGDNEGA